MKKLIAAIAFLKKSAPSIRMALVFLGATVVMAAVALIFIIALSAGVYILEGSPYSSTGIEWAIAIIKWPWYVHLPFALVAGYFFYYISPLCKEHDKFI